MTNKFGEYWDLFRTLWWVITNLRAADEKIIYAATAQFIASTQAREIKLLKEELETLKTPVEFKTSAAPVKKARAKKKI